MQVQNAAERRDVGAATGLAAVPALDGRRVREHGGRVAADDAVQRGAAGGRACPPSISGALRGGAGVGAHLAQARAALGAGFQLAFGACLFLLLVAVAIAAGMRDIQLRSGAAPVRDMGH